MVRKWQKKTFLMTMSVYLLKPNVYLMKQNVCLMKKKTFACQM